MKTLPEYWHWEELPEHFGVRGRFDGMPLLYLHGMLARLEKEIIRQIGGDVARWEKALDDALTWSFVALDCPRPWTENFCALAEHCRRLEAAEIAQLTGRAA